MRVFILGCLFMMVIVRGWVYGNDLTNPRYPMVTVTYLTDSKNEEVAKEVAKFEKSEKPAWWGSQAGITDGVLPPWTPLKVSKNTVKCWGREYRFANLPFPVEIDTAGKQILAGPIPFELCAESTCGLWHDSELKFIKKADAEVVFKSVSECLSVKLESKTSLEYDGMIRIDLKLIPPKPITIDSLTLEIPIKAEHAKYFHYWPGQWGGTSNSGAVPTEGLKLPFKPYVALCDEERGLGWFAESDKGWVVKDSSKALEIVPEDDTVFLRIHLIEGPYPLNEPFEFTFGLQATPVKPIPKNYKSWHICHGAWYGMESSPMRFPAATLTYPANGNFNLAQGTLELWVIPQFDPNVEVDTKIPRAEYNQNLFALNFANGDLVSFYWNIDDRGMRFFVKKANEYPIILGSHSDWQKGELHHVACTWGDEVRIYADGKLLASQPYKGTLEGDLSTANLVFGGWHCDFIIDEIRISDIAREKFELTHQYEPDEHTLILDHLNEDFQPNDLRQTKAAKISGASSEMGGTPGYGGEFVLGKFSAGFKFYPEVPPQTALDKAKGLGVKTLVYHESWTDIQNYTKTTYKKELKNLVSECHKHGIRLLLYFGYEMSDIAPEYETYKDECLVMPRAGGYTRMPKQTAYIVCYNSPWQDFIADGIKRITAEYDIDGVYLDGTTEPWGCCNYHHGCGYQLPDGTWKPTYPIFAVRKLMKRLYAIFKTKKPPGLINPHQSTCMVMPTLAFSDSYWDGEHLQTALQATDEPLRILPLDAFRAEFMGKQWGIPAEFLVYSSKNWNVESALAITMLHDVLVRPLGVNGMLAKIAAIWKLLDEFGVEDAQWHPYWRNAHLIKVKPEDIKVSLYVRPDKRAALLVVSNLGQAEATAEVELNLKKLGFPTTKLIALDGLTQKPVELSAGKLKVLIKPMRMELIWVKPK